MMNLKIKWLFTGVCMFIAMSLIAQSQKKDATTGDDKGKDTKTKPKPKPVPVYLGKTDLSNGNISKHLFDSLVLQGLTSRDSAGKAFKVVEFSMTYAERNLYEDSVGNPIIVADYLANYCFGDTLSAYLKVNIPDRSKPGDTVFFDKILVQSAEGNNALGKPMKFVLTK